MCMKNIINYCFTEYSCCLGTGINPYYPLNLPMNNTNVRMILSPFPLLTRFRFDILNRIGILYTKTNINLNVLL